jgi:phage repressor protein C with HTH and peptisase S24 domain
MKFENIIQRLDYYAKEKGLNDNKITVDAGLSVGSLGKSRAGKGGLNSETIEKILYAYRDLSARWFLTGEGSPTVIPGLNYYPEYDTDNVIEDRTVESFKLKTDNLRGNQNIPLYDMEAVAGLVPLFNDAVKQIPVDYIRIPNLPKCDGAIHITGDSMYPLLKSGDIVLYKRVHDINNGIFWGEMYLISIDIDGEEYVTVKYIQKSDIPEHVRLVSHNQHHSDKDVSISSIRALAFVKASVRVNSMK